MAYDKVQRDRENQQADAEFEKIKVTIEKVKVDVPNKRAELDQILQAVQSIVAHYKQQASQLPAEPQPQPK